MSESRQCEQTKPNGARCKARALPGDSRCFFHSTATAKARDEARSRGGKARSRGPVVLPPDTPDMPLASVGDVCILLRQTINQVRRGELDSRAANAVGYLSSVLLKALEKRDWEKRLNALEAEQQSRSKGK